MMSSGVEFSAAARTDDANEFVAADFERGIVECVSKAAHEAAPVREESSARHRHGAHGKAQARPVAASVMML